MTAGTRTEILAGLTTFLTMSYIVVVNPQILGGAGLPFGGVVTATVLVTALGSILMGALARLPYAVAPGMGLNAFFTVELVKERGLTAEVALGLVVLSGIIFLLLSATPLRRAIAQAIPPHLREGVAGGIGLLLVALGLKSAGIPLEEPEVLVTSWAFNEIHALFFIGLLIAGLLCRARKPSRSEGTPSSLGSNRNASLCMVRTPFCHAPYRAPPTLLPELSGQPFPVDSHRGLYDDEHE